MELDALIIGGGPAGSTTALLLAKAGWSVGLVEKKEFPRRKVCGEFLSATNLPLLNELGLAEDFISMGGPDVRRIGLYTGNEILTASMPSWGSGKEQWGKALGREYLDSFLLQKAHKAGTQLWQPAEAKDLHRQANRWICSLKSGEQLIQITASLIIIANGSWEKNIVQPQLKRHHSSDLLAFKAHFIKSSLPVDLMPLLAFPGGYGGLVHTNDQRVSLSCCIRRAHLLHIRTEHPGLQAGEALFKYISQHCRGLRENLALNARQGNWLAAGPIQPGIRHCFKEGLFFVGNSAGEAHPVVAEGISMAMQSAWLLSRILIEYKKNLLIDGDLAKIGEIYTRQWRQQFVKRIYASMIFAKLAMLPTQVHALLLPVFKQWPGILTLGAKLSGKIKPVT